MRALPLAMLVCLASGGAQAQAWTLKQVCHHGAAFNAVASLTRKDGIARLAYFRLFRDDGTALTDVNAATSARRADGLHFVMPGGHKGVMTLGTDEDTVLLTLEGAAPVTLTRQACVADRERFPIPAPF